MPPAGMPESLHSGSAVPSGSHLALPGVAGIYKASPLRPLCVLIWQRQEIAAALQALTPSPHCSPFPGANHQALPCAHLAVAEAAGACEPELSWCAPVLPGLPACAPVAFSSMPGMVDSSTCTHKEGLQRMLRQRYADKEGVSMNESRATSTCSQFQLRMSDKAGKRRQRATWSESNTPQPALTMPLVRLLGNLYPNDPCSTSKRYLPWDDLQTQQGMTKARQGPIQAPR